MTRWPRACVGLVVGLLLSASSVALTHERVAATTPDHDASLSVAGGTASTPFNIILPPGASCSGSQGYRWETFIATSWLDVSTWLYFTDGPNQPDGTFTSSLRSTTGEVVKARLPAAGGLITGIPQLNLLGLTDSGITNGTYNVGIFCANRNPPGVIGRIDEEPFTMRRFFWEQLITVSDAATMTWTAGGLPPIPVLGPFDVSFGVCWFYNGFATQPAEPAATYVVSTVPPTPEFTTPPGAAFGIRGSIVGQSYSVVVTATNSLGSAVSEPVTCTPEPAPIPAPDLVAASHSHGSITLDWTTPSPEPGDALRYDYTITSDRVIFGWPTPCAVPIGKTCTLPASTNSIVVPTVAGSYSFTVEASYQLPYSGAVSGTATASGDLVNSVIQDLTVVRPVGALVLTQRCGVYGSADSYTDSTFGALPALAASPANADPGPTGYSVNGLPVGTAPTVGAVADPLFEQYPYPVDGNGVATPNYPTHCGIDLGVGKLITSGPRAGQYFTATGRMAQLTVVNTQDVDNGWTLNGRTSTFTRTGGGDSFSGNLLGWNPEVTYDSSPNLDGYDMLVQAGDIRDATSTASTMGLGDISNETNNTLTQSLAKSNAGTSLGMAVIDARLRLLIPVAANAGTYTGTLTFTTI